ncbi:hypothetical protein BU105_07085 [Staphylococcus xylosus]|uniref:P-loop NTPase fold protein n=1 Tax=Staphylococcus xylosus TaxID=1288 RepID=UPI000D1D2CA4|nr:P-loop NTPase fold protein [Staphylococcus xylosus]PTI00121.1 hypothetical protein BU105_07085 [Staphylococcus xylosus]
MEKFKEAITNYIEKDENFAVFVDGGWGTGKTHFFEHDYFLNKVGEDNDEIQGIHDKKCYKKEYISVYGKHSLKEIQEIIVTKILSHVDDDVIKGSLKQGVSNILKMFDIKFLNTENMTASIDDYLESQARDKIKAKLNKNGGRFILIIDDIERLSDGISLKEFLGFIRNVLLDSFNCKVIIVGNKEAIMRESKDEMDDYWEKVISRKLKFPNNLKVGEEIIKKDLVESYFKDSEIQELIEFIRDLSLSNSRSNILNLRTLNLVITDFKHICNKLEKYDIKANMRMSMFTSLFILHNIYRNNEVTEEDFENLRVPDIYSFTSPKENESKSINQLIYEKYFEENKTANKYVLFSNELKNYIQKGIIEVNKYKLHLVIKVKDINVNEENAINILGEYYLYDESEVGNAKEKAIHNIEEKEGPFYYRLNMFMKLNILKEKGVLHIKDYDLVELEDKLLNSYVSQNTNAMEGEDLIELNNFDVSWSNKLEKVKQNLSKKLKDKQQESMISDEIYKKYIRAILNEDRKKRSELEMQYKEVGKVDVFTIFDKYIRYIERELLRSNAKIVYLNRYIYHKGEHYIEDMKNVDDFINEVREMQQKTKDSIAKYNFDTLQGTLANIRENTRLKLTEE